MPTITEEDGGGTFDLVPDRPTYIRAPEGARLTTEANEHVGMAYDRETGRWAVVAKNPGVQKVTFSMNDGKPFEVYFKILAVTGAPANASAAAAAPATAPTTGAGIGVPSPAEVERAERERMKRELDVAEKTREIKFSDQAAIRNASNGVNDQRVLASPSLAFDPARIETAASLDWLVQAAKLAGLWTKHSEYQKGDLRYMLGFYLKTLLTTSAKAVAMSGLATYASDTNRNAIEIARLETDLRGAKDNTDCADIKSNFTEEPKGHWREATFSGGFLGLFKAKSSDFDTIDPKDPAPTRRMFDVLEKMRGIDGLPQLHRACFVKQQWIMLGHRLTNDKETPVPSLCDIAWWGKEKPSFCKSPIADHKMETNGLVLSAAAQIMFALRIRNLLAAMHSMGVQHNCVVPAHVRLDISGGMRVYLTHPNWATIGFGASDAKRIEETSGEWDVFSAWTTMRALKWNTGADWLAAGKSDEWKNAGEWPTLFKARETAMKSQSAGGK